MVKLENGTSTWPHDSWSTRVDSCEIAVLACKMWTKNSHRAAEPITALLPLVMDCHSRFWVAESRRHQVATLHVSNQGPRSYPPPLFEFPIPSRNCLQLPARKATSTGGGGVFLPRALTDPNGNSSSPGPMCHSRGVVRHMGIHDCSPRKHDNIVLLPARWTNGLF